MTRRRLALGAVYLTLLLGGWLAGQWLLELAVMDVRPSTEHRAHAMIVSATVAYVLASAVPFVPGAEIGFALLVAFGARLAVLVYAAMVAALTLAFLVGRFVPSRATAALFDHLGAHRARDLVLQMAPLEPAARAALLSARAPRRIVPALLRHRYLALAVALNLPGNSLLGGGGGIALAAGMSGLYPVPATLLTVALAVAPLPALVLVTGWVP